jgi:hypothetical protein
MQLGVWNHPLLLQVWPAAAEKKASDGYSVDPLAEPGSNPVPGLLQKYQGPVLLTAAPHCAVHCRYCCCRHFDYEENSECIDLGVINPCDGMLDENGNPFGLMVPTTWGWPLERNSINDAYFYFGEYTDYLNGKTDTINAEAQNGYNLPAAAELTINLDR